MKLIPPVNSCSLWIAYQSCGPRKDEPSPHTNKESTRPNETNRYV
jgi:hypothetical protein